VKKRNRAYINIEIRRVTIIER